jgi:folate-binding protein YgfZ
MITQNMIVGQGSAQAPRHSGMYAAFLNAQGRVLHDVFIYPSFLSTSASSVTVSQKADPSWLIEVDRSEVTNLIKHLKKHKLRSKLTFRALDEDELTVWSSWNEGCDSLRWAAYNLESRELEARSSESSILTCVDTRAPGFGCRIITPGSDDLRKHYPDGCSPLSSSEEMPQSIYTLRRILHGIPEGQTEIAHESALPMESNMDVMRGIDFRKGCYVGQELTIRTHHTGVVRKRILPVQLYVDELEKIPINDVPTIDPSILLPLPPSGANVSRISARKGRSAGKFLTGIGNVGLALCRLEMMTDIALTGDSSQYDINQEFKVSWDKGVIAGQSTPGEAKVKALVPPWLREYILTGGVRQHGSGARGNSINDSDGLRAKDMVERLEEEAEEKHKDR